MPLEDVGSFPVEATYELWGQEPADEADLQKLAAYIDREGETPVVVWLLQPAFLTSRGLLVPHFDPDEDRFSLAVKVTQKRIEPSHSMPVLAADEVEVVLAEAEEHYVEQEVPG